MGFDGAGRSGGWRSGGTDRQEAAGRFGTDAFFAAIGRAFVVMCAVVPVLFGIEAIDTLTGHRLDQAGGIHPHHLDGLDGVIFAPLLHASFPHVIGNSVPLILLGTFVLAAGTRRFLLATALIALVSGAGVWLVGDGNTVVVGASGVIFGYFGLLLAKGIVERSWWNAAVALLIGLLYGWQLVGVLPTDETISWQGHLFGFGAGLVLAVLLRRRRAPRAPAGPGAPGGSSGGPGPWPGVPGASGDRSPGDTLDLPTVRLPGA